MKRYSYSLNWLTLSLMYLTLLYSTSLHYVIGVEATIAPHFFLSKPWGELEKEFKDMGALANSGVEMNFSGENFWKISNAWGDAANYIVQTDSLERSQSPYKYRFLPTWIAGWIAKAFSVSVPKAFLILNVASAILASLLFTLFLRDDLRFGKNLSVLGGVLFITMIANTRTLNFPMLEPLSLLFTTLVFMAVSRKNVLLFLVSASLGIVTKEVLLFSSILWLLHHFRIRDSNVSEMFQAVVIALVPVFMFSVVRVALGGAMFEVNYGYDILKGEFPRYFTRLLKPAGLLHVMEAAFLSFSFLWLGFFNIRKLEFLKKSAPVVLPVVAAAILLSGQIARVIGVLFPIVIPGFLLFFSDRNEGSQARTEVN